MRNAVSCVVVSLGLLAQGCVSGGVYRITGERLAQVRQERAQPGLKPLAVPALREREGGDREEKSVYVRADALLLAEVPPPQPAEVRVPVRAHDYTRSVALGSFAQALLLVGAGFVIPTAVAGERCNSVDCHIAGFTVAVGLFSSAVGHVLTSLILTPLGGKGHEVAPNRRDYQYLP